MLETVFGGGEVKEAVLMASVCSGPSRDGRGWGGAVWGHGDIQRGEWERELTKEVRGPW